VAVDAKPDRGSPVPVPPGSVRPASRLPRFHYELIACGLRGHELLGTDVAKLRPVDELVMREPGDGLRWHRCVRCDSWLPLSPPAAPTVATLPAREAIDLPLRGRPLRDRFVLRLISADRLLHFVVLGLLAVGVFVFAAKRAALSETYYRVLDAVQGGVGGPNGLGGSGLTSELSKAFAAKASTLWLAGLVLAGYAVLEGVEAVGLWLGRRWAEYLTFVATALLLIPEVYELTGRVTASKIITLVINLLVVGYLLWAKRLFNLRGGAEAAERARRADLGWAALERTAPPVVRSGTGPARE
jgi:uncharacterized membrane protein (DUF2068 family)